MTTPALIITHAHVNRFILKFAVSDFARFELSVHALLSDAIHEARIAAQQLSLPLYFELNESSEETASFDNNRYEYAVIEDEPQSAAAAQTCVSTCAADALEEAV